MSKPQKIKRRKRKTGYPTVTKPHELRKKVKSFSELNK